MKVRFPITTVSVLLLNIVAFVATSLYPELRAKLANSAMVFYDHEYYRMITSIFVHGGFRHIAGNMLAVTMISCIIEFKIGSFRLLSYILFIGLFAGFISMISSGLIINHKILIEKGTDIIPYIFGGGYGYSGVVSGLFVLITVVYKDFFKEKGTIVTYYFLLLVNAASVGMQVAYLCDGKGGIGYTAHIGGYIGGLICGYVYLYHKAYSKLLLLEKANKQRKK